MEADSNVARFLKLSAQSNPDQPALRIAGADTMLTMHELEKLSSGAAALMAQAGIKRGTRVLLMARPGVELIASVFALFKLGAPPVVIDPGMGLKGFLRCVQHSKPEALVGIPLAHGISRLFLKSFRATKMRVVLNRSFLKEAMIIAPKAPEVITAKSDELAAILFTSGSTGPAKGVRYEHGMFEAQLTLLQKEFAFERGEVDLPMLPIFALFNPALGMTTVVPQMNPSRPAKADPAKIVAALLTHKVTNSFGSPVLWQKIVDHCEANSAKLPTLKRVLMAGAPASPGLIRRLKALMPNGEVYTPYGATEVLPVSCISGSEILGSTWQLTEQGKGTCVGHPLPGVTAKIIAIDENPILSPSDIQELPQGEIGEIIVTGPSVTREYDRLLEATVSAKVLEDQESLNSKTQTKDDGPRTKNLKIWHRMGDVGYFDDQGRLWFCGRIAERVVTRDTTLFTDCVEGIFNTHPDVFRIALLGVGMRGNQKPVLAIEPNTPKFLERNAHGRESRRKLIAELQAIGQNHPYTKDIKDFVFEKTFPVDVRHNAKINRLKLSQKYQH